MLNKMETLRIAVEYIRSVKIRFNFPAYGSERNTSNGEE